jgi:hypothetical protein
MKNISNCKFDLYFFDLKNMSFGVRYAPTPTINEQSYTYNLITSLSSTGGNVRATGYATGYTNMSMSINSITTNI